METQKKSFTAARTRQRVLGTRPGNKSTHTRKMAPSAPIPTHVLQRSTSADVELPPALRGPIIYARDLPGAFCLGTLQLHGALAMLTTDAGYLTSRTETLYGRANIVRRLVPDTAIASGPTALWVWHNGGGKMPLPTQTFVVSNSHYRAAAFGRRIVVHDRMIAPIEIQRLGDLRITSPLRTACDVICMPRESFDRHVGLTTFLEFLKFYHISLEECRSAIQVNTRWPGFTRGLRLLDAVGELRVLTNHAHAVG